MKLVDTTIAVDHLRGSSAATDLLTELVSGGETLVASEISATPTKRVKRIPTVVRSLRHSAAINQL